MYNSFSRVAAVDLKDDAGEQVYGDHAELIKADLRPAQDTWNAYRGRIVSGRYSATPGQPCPEKTGVRHDAHRSSQGQRRARIGTSRLTYSLGTHKH
jgi:hypothetical protein